MFIFFLIVIILCYYSSAATLFEKQPDKMPDEIVVCAETVYLGLTSTPPLENTLGKDALKSIFHMCIVILGTISKELERQFRVISVGTSKSYPGNVKLRKYYLRHCSNADALSYLKKEKKWPKPATKVYKKVTKVADVQVKHVSPTEDFTSPVIG